MPTPGKGSQARTAVRIGLAGELGARIAAAREITGLTSEQFATKAGITRVRLSIFENGRGLPDLPSLLGIARAAKISVSALLGEERTPDIIADIDDAIVYVEIVRPSSTASAGEVEHRIVETLRPLGTARVLGAEERERLPLSPKWSALMLPASGVTETGSRSQAGPDPDVRQMSRDLKALATEVQRLRAKVEPSAPRARRRA